jgi:hypothetical protein
MRPEADAGSGIEDHKVMPCALDSSLLPAEFTQAGEEFAQTRMRADRCPADCRHPADLVRCGHRFPGSGVMLARRARCDLLGALQAAKMQDFGAQDLGGNDPE